MKNNSRLHAENQDQMSLTTRESQMRLAEKMYSCGMLEYFWILLAEAVLAAPPAEWDVA